MFVTLCTSVLVLACILATTPVSI